MLQQLIKSSLSHKGIVLAAVMLVAGLGLFSFLGLPIDAFPDVTNVQVDVISSAPGLSALEIERQVTSPIEMVMRGLPDVVQMRSVTKFGLSVVTLVFEDDVDIYFARELVFQRLEEAASNIPGSVKVEMGPIATAMGEIYQYTLEGEGPLDAKAKIQYLTDLRTVQEWVLAPMLKSVAGVNEINSFGGYFKQYQVIVDPEKMLAVSVTLDDVYRKVEENNQNVGGSIMQRHAEQYIVRGVGLLKSEDDLKNIVLKSSRGMPVFLRDVAEVRIGEAVRQGASIINGEHEAVGGIVMMLRGENAREVTKRVKEKILQINSGNVLPPGVKIVPYYDRSDIVQTSIETVSGALVEGAILVIVVLFLLLRSIRGAIIVILALPLSMLVTFIVMRYAGIDANLMSLGGLAISIGMIIDATIIQVENVQRHLSMAGSGERTLPVVLKAVLEVRKPSILGELIIATTFLPILSLEGLEGKMFTPLALTVAIALISSLLLSIFVIPTLCGMFLRSSAAGEHAVVYRLQRLYRPVLEWSLKKRKQVFLGATLLMLATVLAIPNLGTEFMPVMDEGAFDMDIQLLPGISLDKAIEVTTLVQKKLMQFPVLETLISRTGQTGLALEARGVDKTGFTGMFKPRSAWGGESDKEEILAAMRTELSTIPGMAFSFSQPIQCRIDELVAGTRAQLIVKLFGENMDILRAKSEEIARVLGTIRGSTDLIVERVVGQPYLTVEVDRSKIARHGLNVSDVLRVIEIAVGGKTATRLYEENRSFDVTVRYPENHRNSVESIGNLLVETTHGYRIPLNQVTRIGIVEGPVQISRENGMRRIGIELNVRGRDIGTFAEEAQERIRQNVNLPAGYYTSWGGQFENQQRAMSRLLIIGPVAMVLILLLLYLTFRSVRLVGLVVFNLPFSFVGGVFALLISGLYLSVPASVGFVVLFGVAMLNGIVLVSRFSQLREEGVELTEAIRQGTADRLRPVLMTASIGVLSLVPMLFATGPGSEVQKPLAAVVVGGLITSTILTLVVLPTLYEWAERKWEQWFA